MAKKTPKSGTRRGRKADAIQFIAPTIPNDHIIRDAIAMGLSTSEDSAAIRTILQRHPQNVDTILDSDERAGRQATLIAEGRMNNVLTDKDRVERVLDFVRQSSSEKGEREWLSLLSPDRQTLVDIESYRKLLLKRLNEQIRAVRRKVRDQSKREKSRMAEHMADSDGVALSISWVEAAEDIEEIERIPTGNQLMDIFFGYDEIEQADGSFIKIGGITSGHTYIVGAERGMGKTRWLVDLFGRLCGAPTTDMHGRMVGGMTGLYIQGEETPARFASMFADGVWDEKVHDVHLSSNAVFMTQHESLIRQLRPDIVVIDSKDIMEDWRHPAQAKRNAKIYNRWAVEYGFVLFVISHVNAEGKIKGGTDLPHMFRAEITGAKNEHDPSMFHFLMNKNRGSASGGVLHYKHGPDTVHIVDPSSGGNIIKTEMSPDAKLLSGMVQAVTDSVGTSSGMLSSIREATTRATGG